MIDSLYWKPQSNSGEAPCARWMLVGRVGFRRVHVQGTIVLLDNVPENQILHQLMYWSRTENDRALDHFIPVGDFLCNFIYSTTYDVHSQY